jgi:hypothetical protein
MRHGIACEHLYCRWSMAQGRYKNVTTGKISKIISKIEGMSYLFQRFRALTKKDKTVLHRVSDHVRQRFYKGDDILH